MRNVIVLTVIAAFASNGGKAATILHLCFAPSSNFIFLHREHVFPHREHVYCNRKNINFHATNYHGKAVNADQDILDEINNLRTIAKKVCVIQKKHLTLQTYLR